MPTDVPLNMHILGAGVSKTFSRKCLHRVGRSIHRCYRSWGRKGWYVCGVCAPRAVYDDPAHTCNVSSQFINEKNRKYIMLFFQQAEKIA